MGKEEHLYLVAGDFFWHVLSMDHLIFEPFTVSLGGNEIVLREVDFEPRTWDNELDELAEWVLTERRYASHHRENITKENFLLLVKQIGEVANLTTFEQAQKIRIAACNTQDFHKPMSEGAIVYYHYRGWLLGVLNEFEDILIQVTAILPHQRQQYQEAKATIDTLRQKLEMDLASIETRNNLNQQAANDLESQIEIFSRKLAVSWRIAVYTTASVL